jgi:hypothetical protein
LTGSQARSCSDAETRSRSEPASFSYLDQDGPPVGPDRQTPSGLRTGRSPKSAENRSVWPPSLGRATRSGREPSDAQGDRHRRPAVQKLGRNAPKRRPKPHADGQPAGGSGHRNATRPAESGNRPRTKTATNAANGPARHQSQAAPDVGRLDRQLGKVNWAMTKPAADFLRNTMSGVLKMFVVGSIIGACCGTYFGWRARRLGTCPLKCSGESARLRGARKAMNRPVD